MAQAGVLILAARLGSAEMLERLREMSVFRAVRTAPLASLFELGVMRVVFAMTFVSLIGVALYSFGITVPLPELIVSTLFVALVSALPIAVSSASLAARRSATATAYARAAA